ncbi:Isopenicillin N epimerase [Fundidesulfovibrio magnetotacticus]|uniref:Isopenicillin N epimerase n=1 Tax=Fundidesulfovibrio magnetotacticus TaxID=2730080 RepID=A0A6V8M0A6_9BACT|nr:aminotransferase class V-fold PLP-dependent enzyme [Fundidesulfovibrio magnetotacticus]GFK95287.1 Isopenicillin N epimerase [Fundidesulfovibrio magnetotacticus]
MIPCQRQLFGVPENVCYLNCAFTSPLPQPALEAGRAAMEAKRAPWSMTPDLFFSGLEAAREGFAAVLGADVDGVAAVPAVSYAMALAARNLPLDADRHVLLLDEQFPSNVYPWLKMAPGRVRAVPRPVEGTWSEAVLAHITPEIGLVALPHCHWIDGTVFDLAAVRAACDRVGAHLVVDATQSLGAMPFDMAAARPDFLTASGHKWLLGPYGASFCWAAPQWRGGEPLEENWLNREGSEDFSRLTEYRDAYRPGARRYDVGEASNFILMPMAAASLGLIQEWGVAGIAATLSGITRRLALTGQAFGLTPTPAAERAPHLLGLRLAHGKAAPVAAAMAREGVHVSPRGATLRLAPHLHVNDADLTRFADALARALST